MEAMQLWGGVECTVNRVGDEWFNQLERSGHAHRDDDLELIATLGVRALRYPVLWERHARDGLERADWSWSDARLARLRELGIAPIAGLVHHGSGPAHTSLVSPCFPEKLAAYASAVAGRYPWLDMYTPVNEPLTTARFSGLYGVWYPHARDPRVFKDALFNECRGTVLAMRAIRAVNPSARLVQTDDLGKYYSTPHLAYQRDFNNRFRWLAWDLLCGRVIGHHPIRDWLLDVCGATEAEIDWFAENACPPDVVGINHYVTSERVIDERLDRYPARYHGGNGYERYADVEAVRSLAGHTEGLRALLCEAWERYRIPVAVTEVQLDSTRDEQMRWVLEVWREAQAARAEGADVRAVTAWALFGSFDWNCLVTACHGYYEPGAFDVRGGKPRATAVAKLLATLAAGGSPDHPVFAAPGWWRREGRHTVQPIESRSIPAAASATMNRPPAAPILLTGASGTLGRAFARMCERRGLAYRLLSRAEMDIGATDAIERAVDDIEPWAVINAAGYVRVDDAERDAARCYRENAYGPANLAEVCARHRLPLVTFSTDLVFDGRRDAPYAETDRIAPLNVYGRSKAVAEGRVLDRHPAALVVRTSAFFGPWDPYNFVAIGLARLASGLPFEAANDLTMSPTYVPHLVDACLDLLIDGEAGIWHLTSGDALTWESLARRAARLAGLDPDAVTGVPADRLGFVATRPRYSALRSERAAPMPTLEAALDRFLAERTDLVAPVNG